MEDVYACAATCDGIEPVPPYFRDFKHNHARCLLEWKFREMGRFDNSRFYNGPCGLEFVKDM